MVYNMIFGNNEYVILDFIHDDVMVATTNW